MLRSSDENRVEEPFAPAAPAEPAPSSVLELVRKLKELIGDKDKIITERTRELKEARRRLENILASMGDAVVVLGPEGSIDTVNESTLELLGYRRDELLGRPARELWHDPKHADLFSPEHFFDLVRGGVVALGDMSFRAKDGRAIAVSWKSSPLSDGDRILGLVGIARDVRVERKLEEEKLRTVRALAASVAHEIRNPLGAIQNSVSLLRRDLPLSPDDRTLMDIVFSETERIGGIVTQFLSFARPSELMLAAGDLPGLLREIALLAEKDERARPAAEEGPGIEILVSSDADLPPVRFDADKLRQVLWNLVGDALDAKGSRVAIRARRTSSGVEVRVADDGKGMPPEVLARTFEPFRTTKARGTGLGLVISRSIVEAHGGSIRIESAPGEGTTVSFTLPGSVG